MKNLVLLIVMIMFASCGNLPIDNVPSPIDNNLYQVEMDSCKKGVGLLGCGFNYQTDTENKFLKIPVTYKGEYLIRSSRCSFNENKRFENVDEIKISWAKLLENRAAERECLFDVKIFIDGFDKGFKGIFRLVDFENFATAAVTFKGKRYVGVLSVQRRESDTPSGIPFEFLTDRPGTFVGQGCGKTIEFEYTRNPLLKMEELILPKEIKSCNFTIGLIPNDQKNVDDAQLFSLLLSQYDRKTTPLILPFITHSRSFGRNYMKVKVEGSVAVIRVGKIEKVFKCGSLRSCQPNKLRTIKVRYYKDKIYWIKYYTKAGRLMVVAYKNGEIIWKPETILY